MADLRVGEGGKYSGELYVPKNERPKFYFDMEEEPLPGQWVVAVSDRDGVKVANSVYLIAEVREVKRRMVGACRRWMLRVFRSSMTELREVPDEARQVVWEIRWYPRGKKART